MLIWGSTRRKNIPQGNLSTMGALLKDCTHTLPGSPMVTCGVFPVLVLVEAAGCEDVVGTSAARAERMLTGRGVNVTERPSVPMLPLALIFAVGTATVVLVFAPCTVSVRPS